MMGSSFDYLRNKERWYIVCSSTLYNSHTWTALCKQKFCAIKKHTCMHGATPHVSTCTYMCASHHCMHTTKSPQPFPSIFAYCKRSKLDSGQSMRTMLHIQCMKHHTNILHVMNTTHTHPHPCPYPLLKLEALGTLALQFCRMSFTR